MSDISQTDYLVIGSGIAGLSFALKAAETGSVTLITKKEFQESNTNYAQGGIASVLDPDDSFELHLQDTLNAGAGLCREDVVDMVVRAGPEMVQSLMVWGTEFTRSGKNLALGREGGHSKNRIVFAADLTGREIERALTEAAAAHPNISLYEHHMAIDLITEHHVYGSKISTPGKIHCWGVYALDTLSGQVKTFLARFTLLCSGGCGQIYLHTTNPAIATGDGIAMAYRAGARVGNLEFMQFHPTTLYHPDADSFLISEAVRGHGGVLIDLAGRAFMDDYHEMGSLAPRDVVARAIDSELKKSGKPCVFLDITQCPAGELQIRFPTIYQRCLTFGIDITKEPIPVVPAAHYMCGGVFSDTWGRTDIEGLYASGEVSCTGLHGANRLASNSLLEALVFSDRAIQDITQRLDSRREFPDVPPWQDDDVFNTEEWVLLAHDRQEVRRLMWDYVGIVRSDFRLKRAARRIGVIMQEVEEFYKRTQVTEALIELRNMTTVAALTVRCALDRRESRGLHYTLDCPNVSESVKDTALSAWEMWGTGLPVIDV
ncbi:MAG: L-aspartate oxidase [Candidatus Latescibacteria bacterium]|nr:L-aspartate oxidase [Candidatus Latescibacterota bacterium]